MANEFGLFEKLSLLWGDSGGCFAALGSNRKFLSFQFCS